jgi:hypothetical protein
MPGRLEKSLPQQKRRSLWRLRLLRLRLLLFPKQPHQLLHRILLRLLRGW